jgi:hypothetical protein
MATSVRSYAPPPAFEDRGRFDLRIKMFKESARVAHVDAPPLPPEERRRDTETRSRGEGAAGDR